MTRIIPGWYSEGGSNAGIMQVRRNENPKLNFDECAKSRRRSVDVIPALAGIQLFQLVIDSRLPRNDEIRIIHEIVIFSSSVGSI